METAIVLLSGWLVRRIMLHRGIQTLFKHVHCFRLVLHQENSQGELDAEEDKEEKRESIQHPGALVPGTVTSQESYEEYQNPE